MSSHYIGSIVFVIIKKELIKKLTFFSLIAGSWLAGKKEKRERDFANITIINLKKNQAIPT